MKSALSLKQGDKARIIKLIPDNEAQLRKFLAFGLTPSALIEVIQVFPVYILKIDFTLLALDKKAVNAIIIEQA